MDCSRGTVDCIQACSVRLCHRPIVHRNGREKEEAVAATTPTGFTRCGIPWADVVLFHVSVEMRNLCGEHSRWADESLSDGVVDISVHHLWIY